MTKPTRTLTVLAALLALGTSMPAAPTLQVATVDLDRALNEYWKTQKKSGEFMDRNKGAQEQVDDVQKRMAAIMEEAKKLQEEANNPALNKEAKDRIMADAEKKAQEFQNLRERLGQFVENTQRDLDRDRKLFMDLMYGEINTIVLNLAKTRGATFVVDTSGRTTSGVSSILYADPGFDITNDVIGELNKTKPADFVPPTLPGPPAQ
jgi:outer membrane protein